MQSMVPQLPATCPPPQRFARYQRGDHLRRELLPGLTPLPLPVQALAVVSDQAAAPESLFSYDNANWRRVAPAPRREGLLAVENLMDQLAMYLNGELTETQFDEATRRFRSTIFKAAPTPLMQPRPLLPVRSQIKPTPAGLRLGELLATWLDVQAAPALDIHEQDGFRYQLYRWDSRDGVLIQRRAPDQRRLLAGRIACSRAEAQAVLVELGAEYERLSVPVQQRTVITRPAASDGERQLKALLERGPVTDPFAAKSDEIDELNKAAFDAGRKKAQETLKTYQDMMAARQGRMH
jgi:hypothetical protein